MSEPITKFASCANVFCRMMHFDKAGDSNQGHLHDYDHVTLVATGSVKVIVEGKESTFTAPHFIFINKDKEHQLIALEDNTVAVCIHGARDESGDIIDPSYIPQ
jgi:quercetin dioxygenase-like cupin family protein